METAVFTCWLLFLMFSPVVPICLPTDFTMHVEKPECDFCVAINTTICMGFCPSWDRIRQDKNRPPYIQQIGCTYDKVEHRTAILPGCPIEANPVFTYPVALSCRCDSCRTETNECVQRASPVGSSCTKPVKMLYPYPDQSNYMTSF
ncbi:LOW QUALITY PROTEIN: thyroid stimulating hormone subunit beta a [Cheilinus undulatus]|uniref:LOW QUALITY PROTEIN: thyroid stimulating hormone subunit beta a n=1 Tax=Cheilinus undulatus TaxID=241271 RepID=UPI001BD20262|nr:LOW QUALITY PROTEIN: thyroid stimulating hormone subunit beta a [Cheilinus undulatus]